MSNVLCSFSRTWISASRCWSARRGRKDRWRASAGNPSGKCRAGPNTADRNDAHLFRSHDPPTEEGKEMGLIILIILILLIVGAVPSWPYNRSWGWGPSGLIGLLLVILLVLLILGAIPWGWGPRAVVVGAERQPELIAAVPCEVQANQPKPVSKQCDADCSCCPCPCDPCCCTLCDSPKTGKTHGTEQGRPEEQEKRR